MANFKLNIADPKAGKCYKTEVKEAQADAFIGLNIGEKIDGSKVGLDGYELQITGGTDFCGFPMRQGILGVRKRITMYRGLGFSGIIRGRKNPGAKKRRTVCGHKINDKISALNVKVLKEGSQPLSSLFVKTEPEAKK